MIILAALERETSVSLPGFPPSGVSRLTTSGNGSTIVLSISRILRKYCFKSTDHLQIKWEPCDGLPNSHCYLHCLAVNLNREVIPQHATSIENIYGELLRQRIRLVAHHHTNAEIPHFGILRHRARTRKRLRQATNDESDRVPSKCQI